MPVIVLDVALPHSLGFIDLAALPYIALLPVVTLAMGSVAGLAAALSSFLWVALLGPALLGNIDLPAYVGSFETVPVGTRYAAAILALSGVILTNRIRRVQSDLDRTRERSRNLDRDLESTQKEAQALALSLRATNNRVAAERSSITIMHEQVKQLHSLDQQEVLNATLAGVRLITGASSCAIYRFHEQTLKLHRLASWPARDDSWYAPTLTVASSIPGRVVRTGRLFSLREMVDHPELRKIDDKRSIICAPIVVRNQIWGVLNIGRLPFLHYNEYAEKGLQVVAALAAPALEHAMPSTGPNPRSAAPDEKLSDINKPESLVYPYEQLYDTLQQRATAAEQQRYHVALFLIELQTHLSEDESFELCETVGGAVAHAAGASTTVFHYQQAGQLAVVSVGAGSDATGYLLLRISELIGGRAWMVFEQMILPQAYIGFATSTQSGFDATKLILRAERVLALQRAEEPGE